MDYWEAVLDEVMHKDDESFQFRFTDIGRSILRERNRQRRNTSTERPGPIAPAYYIGPTHEGVYFTRREAQTLFHLLKGKTIPEVGRSLDLSARTIEFYVKNMKLKIGVKSKAELLDKLRHTDIIRQLNLFDAEDRDGD